ncbi:MAG: hypothetical protein AAGI72_15440 [Pseudomonadota bacterium]
MPQFSKFTAEILGIVSILMTIGWGVYITGVKLGTTEGEIKTLATRIHANTESIKRVETRMTSDQNRILGELDKHARAMETIRVEAKEDRRMILDQIQRLTDRHARTAMNP